MRKFSSLVHGLRPHAEHRMNQYWLYLMVFIASGGVLWLAVGLPYVVARHNVISQAHAMQSAVQKAKAAASTLVANGQLGNIKLRQIGPAKTFAVSLQELTDDFTPSVYTSPSILLPPVGLPTSYPYRFVASTNKMINEQATLRRNITSTFQETKKLLVHHSAITFSLVNLLSYDPRVDFAKFDLSGSDTRHRLELAHSGLIRTKQIIENNQTPDDPTLHQLVVLINGLEQSRQKLASSGDVASWTDAVDSAQSSIISNRNLYWNDQAGSLANRLDILATQLDANAKSWTILASGRP